VFTGIVVEQGVVQQAAPKLVLESRVVSTDVALGDSVAVDGCCLTVTHIDGRLLSFDTVPETLERTMLGDRAPGDVINLEAALRAGDRMGGHWVQGHVDGVGRVLSLTPHENAVDVRIAAPPAVLRYVIEKGSIAVNGVSLTVTGFDDESFGVSLIPHTMQETNFGRMQPGDRVNLEADLFGKYVERLAAGGLPSEQHGT
jgi:riboflavin synthase